SVLLLNQVCSPDSDEEDVTAHRRLRRNAIRDSDSEEEEAAAETSLKEALVLPASSGEEEEEEEEGSRDAGGRRSRRVSHHPADGEEQGGDMEEVKKRERSQRNREKKGKRSKAMEDLRKKKKKAERFSEEEEDDARPLVLNDSGCPLGDPDLFDTGLGDEDEEEESLDPIRAAVKQKMKKLKVNQEVPHVGLGWGGGGWLTPGLTVAPLQERRAARASREAMKELHSESQRLIRESTLGLPYHVPQPKTIDQFFRRRTRPEGSAMKLLTLKQRLQLAMAQRRQEERARKAALHRLDNEECEEEEEEEEDMTDESEEEVKLYVLPGFQVVLLCGSGSHVCFLRRAWAVRCRFWWLTPSAVFPADEEDSLMKDGSHNSSFELGASMITSYQPVNQRAMPRPPATAFRSPSPCFFRPSILGSASKSSGRLSQQSLCLPVEDSQDLYAPASPGADSGPLGGPVPGPGGDSQGRFSLEDEVQSQLLDADGFLNVGPRPGASHKRQLVLDNLDENAMDANMGELLGFCSRGFGTAEGGADPVGGLEAFREDELLGLCSGAFPETPAEQRDRSDKPMERLLRFCSGTFPSQGEDTCSSHVLRFLPRSPVPPTFSGHPGSGSVRRTLMDFVDSEAELSGSDVGSDDEEGDVGSEYEEEELLEELPSDEELHNQVNKIHMKQILDDDKRRLRFYQERYLADGDLHSDGPGRARRFRWKNMGELREGGEEEEDVDPAEVQRRKARLEREQWLREQVGSVPTRREDPDEDEKLEEDSRFMKLARKLTARTLQRKGGSRCSCWGSVVLTGPALLQVRRGSLLGRPQAVLQKLANISEGNLLAPRSTRGFLFQTLSPEKVPAPADAPHKVSPEPGQNPPVREEPGFSFTLGTRGVSLRSIFSFLDH
uniref:Claspin n=1 Tax=Fundulus heteroclitus TaxID=8078 RepID=A0A3Q2PWS9_FUNHE